MSAATDEPSFCSERVRALRECTPLERADAIEQLGALLCSVKAELLDVITAADAEGDWVQDGATGMAPWLVGMLHVSSETARSWVKVGAALDALPHLREAFSEGLLSFDQVKPATTFVTPDTDADETQRLQGWPDAQVEDLARQHRTVNRRRAKTAGERRFFRSRVDHEAGGRRYSGFLPETEAARLDAVLDRKAEQMGKDEATGLFEPMDARRADALVDLSHQAAAEQADPDSCLVVVHAPAEVIDGAGGGNGQIGDLQVPRESVLRMLCDAKVEFHLDTPNGLTIGIGRADRTIPRWLRRRILRRDGGCCRFPGCERRVRQIHHLRWWRNEGPTDANNLVGLCWYHHRLVHQGGWTIDGNPEQGDLTFTSPLGRRLRSKPNPLRRDTRTRATHAAGSAPTAPLRPVRKPPKTEALPSQTAHRTGRPAVMGRHLDSSPESQEIQQQERGPPPRRSATVARSPVPRRADCGGGPAEWAGLGAPSRSSHCSSGGVDGPGAAR
ncbi:MAG: DUF222 domain-containing protein [Actinomycetota bacterium]